MALEEHAAGLLRELIGYRTVNPPGSERAAQEHLAAILEAAGFDVTLVGRTADRPNLVARLSGREPGAVLGLLSHIDTVPAEPEHWQHDPWSGAVAGGDIWGRGAQDMKSQTAAEVAAAVDLARGGWRPSTGELLVIVVADEERGGGEGALWLCAEHLDLVRCDYLLNEGAGALIEHAGARLFGVCTAEKGVCRFTLTVHGRPGHASMPAVADNPVLGLARLIDALAGERPEIVDPAGLDRLLAAFGVPDLGALAEVDPLLAGFVEPMVAVTFAPTVLTASETINVIPAAASAGVDCRTPPGLGRDAVEQALAAALSRCDVPYEITFDEEVVGNGSPAGTPLMSAIERWLAEEEPGARAVPVTLPAYTDSRAFRDAFPDCVAYGFFPQRERRMAEAWKLVHGIDERIAVADVGLAARCYRAIILDLLG